MCVGGVPQHVCGDQRTTLGELALSFHLEIELGSSGLVAGACPCWATLLTQVCISFGCLPRTTREHVHGGALFRLFLLFQSARNTAISLHSHQNPPFLLKETCSTICQANLLPPVMTPSQTPLKLICEMLVLGQPDCSERRLGCQLCIHLAM